MIVITTSRATSGIGSSTTSSPTSSRSASSHAIRGSCPTASVTGSRSFKSTMMEYGASQAWAQAPSDMAVAQNQGIYDAEFRAARPDPTPFRQWCEEVLKPAL